jgi:hypothetical protein
MKIQKVGDRTYVTDGTIITNGQQYGVELIDVENYSLERLMVISGKLKSLNRFQRLLRWLHIIPNMIYMLVPDDNTTAISVPQNKVKEAIEATKGNKKS